MPAWHLLFRPPSPPASPLIPSSFNATASSSSSSSPAVEYTAAHHAVPRIQRDTSVQVLYTLLYRGFYITGRRHRLRSPCDISPRNRVLLFSPPSLSLLPSFLSSARLADLSCQIIRLARTLHFKYAGPIAAYSPVRAYVPATSVKSTRPVRFLFFESSDLVSAPCASSTEGTEKLIVIFRSISRSKLN